MARLFDCPNERGGVPLKLPAGRCQRRARLVADEEHATELVFQRADVRADSRLADMKPVRGADEIVLASSVSVGSTPSHLICRC